MGGVGKVGMLLSRWCRGSALADCTTRALRDESVNLVGVPGSDAADFERLRELACADPAPDGCWAYRQDAALVGRRSDVTQAQEELFLIQLILQESPCGEVGVLDYKKSNSVKFFSTTYFMGFLHFSALFY